MKEGKQTMMNQKNESNQSGQSNATSASEEEYTVLIGELSRECLRLETENAELARRLKEQPDATDQKQSKADADAFAELLRENQARRRQ